MSSSKKYVAKRKAKGDMIKFVLESIVIAMVIAITTSFASCTLFGGEQKHNVGTRTEQTKTGDDENQNGGNNNIVVNPGNENGNSGENNQNENNNENSGENNNNGGENSGENGGDQEDPNSNTGENGENQGENGEENQGENGNENGGENGNGGDNGNENPESPNPDDPTPDDPKPDDPKPDDPQPEELDFSGLEEKLVEIAGEVKDYYDLQELVSYSIDDENVYFVADLKLMKNNMIAIYKAKNTFDLNTQEGINGLSLTLDKSSFIEIASMQKTKVDIKVDGVTYSKEGIEGDNPFARQCGVENAWMTYVSDPGTQTFANTETGYGKIVKLLILGNSNSAMLKEIVVESFSGISNDQVYQNFLQSRAYENSSQQYTLGDNLKKTKIAEASDLEWSYSFN